MPLRPWSERVQVSGWRGHIIGYDAMMHGDADVVAGWQHALHHAYDDLADVRSWLDRNLVAQ